MTRPEHNMNNVLSCLQLHLQ